MIMPRQLSGSGPREDYRLTDDASNIEQGRALQLSNPKPLWSSASSTVSKSWSCEFSVVCDCLGHVISVPTTRGRGVSTALSQTSFLIA